MNGMFDPEDQKNGNEMRENDNPESTRVTNDTPAEFEYLFEPKRMEDTYAKDEKPRAKSHPGLARVLLVVAAVFVCATLCFAGGVVGSFYALRGLPTEPVNADGAGAQQQSLPTGRDTEKGKIAQGKDVNESNRNPSPTIGKSESIGTVNHTGSAGEAGYATLAEAISAVAPSVVEISTETRVSGGWLGNYISSGAGSGVIISTDGYIVTNNHVIAGADTITVRLTSGEIYLAKLIGTDENSDIAVIWVDAGETELPAASLGCSGDLIVGESVFAIGNPLGSLGGTVTNGIISATARDISINGTDMTLLQTNAAVNPGNSGGGLFNMAGQLVGVVNAKCSEDDVEGLGFAIPIDTAYDVICELIEYGYVRGIADAGLSLYLVEDIFTAWQYNLPGPGIYIIRSDYSDELKNGDMLLTFDGVSISSVAQVNMLARSHKVGDDVPLTVYRSGKELTVILTLYEYIPSGVSVRFEDAG